MLPARHNDWMPDIFNDFFDTNWMDRPKATAPAINVIETPEEEGGKQGERAQGTLSPP